MRSAVLGSRRSWHNASAADAQAVGRHMPTATTCEPGHYFLSLYLAMKKSSSKSLRIFLQLSQAILLFAIAIFTNKVSEIVTIPVNWILPVTVLLLLASAVLNAVQQHEKAEGTTPVSVPIMDEPREKKHLPPNSFNELVVKGAEWSPAVLAFLAVLLLVLAFITRSELVTSLSFIALSSSTLGGSLVVVLENAKRASPQERISARVELLFGVSLSALSLIVLIASSYDLFLMTALGEYY